MIQLPQPIFGLNGHGPIAGHPLYVEQPLPSGKDWRDPDVQMAWSLSIGGQKFGPLPGPIPAFPIPDGASGNATLLRSLADGSTQSFAVPVQAFPRKPIFVDTANGIDGPNRGSSATSPLKSVPKIAGDSHVGLYYFADAPQDIHDPILFNDCSDIWIGRFGAAKQAAIRVHCQHAFQCNANTADVTWVNAIVTSDFSGAAFGSAAGRNFAAVNIALGEIENGLFDSSDGLAGFYIDGLASALALPQYSIFLGNTHRLVCLNPNLAGSLSQIPVRITGNDAIGQPGLVKGMFCGGVIRQPTTASKAAFDLRKALTVGVYKLEVRNGNSSANSEGNYPTEISDVLYVDHVLTNAKLEIHEGAHNIRVRGGTSMSPGSECYSFQNFPRRTNGTMAHALEDIRVEGVRGMGAPGNPAHCLAKYYGATAAQASVNNSELDAPTGTPLFKDASGNPVNAGSGNKLVVT